MLIVGDARACQFRQERHLPPGCHPSGAGELFGPHHYKQVALPGLKKLPRPQNPLVSAVFCLRRLTADVCPKMPAIEINPADGFISFFSCQFQSGRACSHAENPPP
jgi:hypothetical protein